MSRENERPSLAMDKVVAFEEIPTAALSDAMDELGVSCVLPRVAAQRRDQGRVAGYALPVRFNRVSHDAAAYRFGGGVGRPLERVLQTMHQGQIVVFDLDGSLDASPWGGLASRMAAMKGVRGTVVYGTCRDVDDIRGQGYPVWALGTCPRRSRNEFTFGSIGDPLDIVGTRVGLNDIVVADATGVVIVPQDKAVAVLDLARQIVATESKLLGSIAQGTSVDWDRM